MGDFLQRPFPNASKIMNAKLVKMQFNLSGLNLLLVPKCKH
jgi:hypothetical protein